MKTSLADLQEIRYKKTFGNLQPEVVQEYLDDNLKNKKYTK